ncbi:isochorismate synthase (plasmid) [Streptosporangium sp. CA-135522]|uniref:isochorismate synthase n=1 Tax=Streptosporangium sp. CA-135522 TaxID=3240072 RepID=UPI003D938C51
MSLTTWPHPAAPTLVSLLPSVIDRYDARQSTLFATGEHTLLTQGRQALITGELSTLAQRVAATLTSDLLTAGSIAAGAVSFDGAAQLIVPRSAEWAGPLQAPADRGPCPAWRIRPMPAEQDYLKAVRGALQRIADGTLTKAVLARSLELSAEAPIDTRTLLINLIGRGSYVFGVPLPGERTLIGASPELLVSRYGRDVVAHPLAGSAARSADPATDRQRAHDLRRSAKDLREHRVVIEAVAEALRPYCSDLSVPRTPSLVATPTMWHLGTRVTGEIADLCLSSLTLAAALHPTPAVCGTPTAAARTAIDELEEFDRGFYAGLVGWTDASGDGEWALTIRCAEVASDTLRLFAGAGIDAGSIPEAELAETSAKCQTMLQALGVHASL